MLLKHTLKLLPKQTIMYPQYASASMIISKNSKTINSFLVPESMPTPIYNFCTSKQKQPYILEIEQAYQKHGFGEQFSKVCAAVYDGLPETKDKIRKMGVIQQFYADKIKESVGDTSYAYGYALLQLANCHLLQRNTTAFLQTSQQAYKIIKPLKPDQARSIVHRIAVVHNQTKDYQKSDEYLNRYLNQFNNFDKQMVNENIRYTVYTVGMENGFRLGRFEQALKLSRKIVQLITKTKSAAITQTTRLISLINCAYIQQKLGSPLQALQTIQQAKKYLQAQTPRNSNTQKNTSNTNLITALIANQSKLLEQVRVALRTKLQGGVTDVTDGDANKFVVMQGGQLKDLYGVVFGDLETVQVDESQEGNWDKRVEKLLVKSIILSISQHITISKQALSELQKYLQKANSKQTQNYQKALSNILTNLKILAADSQYDKCMKQIGIINLIQKMIALHSKN